MIIILGMAGAGKSTQCRMLLASGAYQWLAVGELLRSLETGTNRAEMMHGKVLNDDIVTPIVRAEMIRLGDSPELLLDGCPRTIGQAQWLTSDKQTPKVRKILHLVVNDETALERLMKRGREDDNEEAMRLRFAGYHRDIGLVLDVFRSAGIPVYEFDANQDETMIYEDIRKVLS
jgi:adenylate kinase